MPGESPVALPAGCDPVCLLTVHRTGTLRYFLCDWAAHGTAARFVVAAVPCAGEAGCQGSAAVFANSSGPDGFS